MNNTFYGKRTENDDEKYIEKQSKVDIIGIHKPSTTDDSYTIRQIEVHIDEPLYLGSAVLEFRRMLMYETCYDLSQPFFWSLKFIFTLCGLW